MGHTLTTLTGEEDEITEDSSISDDIDSDVILVDDYTAAVKKRAIQIENLPSFVFDASIDPGMYILIFSIFFILGSIFKTIFARKKSMSLMNVQSL